MYHTLLALANLLLQLLTSCEPCSVETHAIDLDDEPNNEELGNGHTENGHAPAEPMSEDREADGEEEPTSTNPGEGKLLL